MAQLVALFGIQSGGVGDLVAVIGSWKQVFLGLHSADTEGLLGHLGAIAVKLHFT